MTQEEKDIFYMQKALAEAKYAFEKDEIPVVYELIKFFLTNLSNNISLIISSIVTAHAEMQAITSAANHLGNKYLTECTLYVTLEPCQMCAGAMYWAQLNRLVYGASDNHRGYKVLGTKLHPKTKVKSGVLSKECKLIVDAFFIKKRKEKALQSLYI